MNGLAMLFIAALGALRHPIGTAQALWQSWRERRRAARIEREAGQ